MFPFILRASTSIPTRGLVVEEEMAISEATAREFQRLRHGYPAQSLQFGRIFLSNVKFNQRAKIFAFDTSDYSTGTPSVTVLGLGSSLWGWRVAEAQWYVYFDGVECGVLPHVGGAVSNVNVVRHWRLWNNSTKCYGSNKFLVFFLST